MQNTARTKGRNYTQDFTAVPISNSVESETRKSMREVAILDAGKSFGELALIMQKPRAATIKCLDITYFATLDKQDFEASLARIEKKRIMKLSDFMSTLPCFNTLT